MQFTATALAAKLGGVHIGADAAVQRLAPPAPGCEGAVVVVSNEEQLQLAAQWQPAVVVAPSGLGRPGAIPALISVEEPRLALARLTELFDDRPLPQPGIHPGAWVADDARLGDGVRVGAGAVVSAGAIIGNGTVICEGATIGAGSVLGEGCLIYPRASLLDGVELGQRVTIHSGAVVGSDGFGYVASERGAVKLRHLGRVVLGDDVELGANSCIDRGTLGDTTIGDRTKIDNLCQVAHNVTIGSDCLIAGQCGIAGSTRIGNRVTMAGSVGVGDHLTVGDGATLGPRAAVIKNVPPGETWIGYPAQPYRRFARQSYLLGRLERIWRFVKEREGRVAE